MVENLYLRTLAAAGTVIGSYIGVTYALDWVSSPSSYHALVGVGIFCTSIFLGGWLLVRILGLDKLAKFILGEDEVDDARSNRRNGGSNSDRTSG